MAGQRMLKYMSASSFATVLLWGTLAQAAAPVENRSGSQSGSNAELYYQMQQLQQEIMELRGQLEEQSYRLRRLEKQRLDDYKNIDKRLQESSKARTSSSTRSSSAKKSTASTAAAASAAASTYKPKPKPSSTAKTTKSASVSERDAYQQAFQQLKKQELKQAQSSFEQFLRDYPNGQYSANAYYWLGELYLTDENLPKARKTFSTLIEGYPDFRKTPDSSFKLAKIYHQMGDDQKAETLLKKIVTTYGQTSPSTVNLASAYLDKHFR